MARAALSVLLEAIPEGERGAASTELLDFTAALHRRRRLKPPAWMDVLRGGADPPP